MGSASVKPEPKPAVLVVDPDAAAQAALARGLGPEVEVRPAFDTATALDRLRSEPFAVVSIN